MKTLREIALFVAGIVGLVLLLGLLLTVGCVNIQDGFEEGYPLELPVYEKVR